MSEKLESKTPVAATTACSPSFGGNADFSCESCGTLPTWGMAHSQWWLTCDCWQTDVGSPDAVFANWRKDRPKRIKANEPLAGQADKDCSAEGVVEL